MAYVFNLDRHNAFYEKHGWSHAADCVCKRNDLHAVWREVQRLPLTSESGDGEEGIERTFRAFGEVE